MFTAVLVFILFRVAQDNKGFDDEEEGMKRWTFFFVKITTKDLDKTV